MLSVGGEDAKAMITEVVTKQVDLGLVDEERNEEYSYESSEADMNCGRRSIKRGSVWLGSVNKGLRSGNVQLIIERTEHDRHHFKDHGYVASLTRR